MSKSIALTALFALLSGLASSATTNVCTCTTKIPTRSSTSTLTLTGTDCASVGVPSTCPVSSVHTVSVRAVPPPTPSTSTLTTSSTTSTKSTGPSTSPVTSSTKSTTSIPSTTTSTRSTASTSTTSSSACVPSPTKSVGKRGVSYNSTPLTNLFSLSCSKSKTTWSYNWYSLPASDGQSSSYNSVLEYIPLLWSNATDLTSVWAANAQKGINAGASALMSFNEPDGCANGGSCMSVEDSIKTYKAYMQPFAGKARLGAPAVTNGGDPMGLTYLQNFLSGCTGCTIDFVPIHWYGYAFQARSFKSYVAKAYAAGGNRPLWITEFGCLDGPDADDKVQAFLKDVLPWLDQTSYVERYAYFMARPGLLVNDAGTALSADGVLYETV